MGLCTKITRSFVATDTSLKIRRTCTPDKAFTTVDFPCATWPIVPENFKCLSNSCLGKVSFARSICTLGLSFSVLFVEWENPNERFPWFQTEDTLTDASSGTVSLQDIPIFIVACLLITSGVSGVSLCISWKPEMQCIIRMQKHVCREDNTTPTCVPTREGPASKEALGHCQSLLLHWPWPLPSFSYFVYFRWPKFCDEH